MRTLIFLLSLFSVVPLIAEQVSLFDGKSLEGWDYDPKVWRVEEGVITGGSTTEKIPANYFICTKKAYQNFDLKLKIKCSGDPKTGMINSGIQIRSLRVPGGAHMSGYQVDCGAGWFGKIYDEYRRNKVIAEPLNAVALAKAVEVFGWNEYRIRAEGPRIQVWINGVAAIDYTEQDKNIALDGQIAPQVHSGGICLVQVKDVVIEELPPTSGAPTWKSLGGVEAARKLVAPPPKSTAQAGSTKKTKGGRDISYNAIQGTARTAAEQLQLFKLPAGYEIELVVQESEGLGKFVSVYFDQRGRMWTQTAFEYPVDANENPAAAEALYQGRGKDKVLVYPREALQAPLPARGFVNPTVFCDGLAIPLGILPWGNGDSCYVQHGHDLKLFKDTDGDGKADRHEVILTGFGVQDSHLFPHQFTRAPGGWLWMAQGLFNNSKVRKPDGQGEIDWPKCSMARLRPDGSEFEVTSTGPNNIWGLAITSEGETFIQEANDYGYPVMPFHDYAYYPGGMEGLKKSFQPEFPATAEFRMGGTGLSGLAIGDGDFRKLTPSVKDDGFCMFVANPITSKVQTIGMHRDGPYWKLEQAADLITCEDPFFRPVALTYGPDRCIYIVDWYNKIISHNEVPRAHPDRDKTRGRIWRVKPKGLAPSDSLDMTTLETATMLDYLESPNPWAQRVASEILADRKAKDLLPSIRTLVNDENKSASTRIHALWAWEQLGEVQAEPLALMLRDSNRHIRREAVRALSSFARELGTEGVIGLLKELGDERDPDVRRAMIQTLGTLPRPNAVVLTKLMTLAGPALPGPTAQSSRSPRQVPVREAYDRDFERFLIRMFLERHPAAVAAFLDSDAAAKLPVESRVLSSLALEPRLSASRVATLLPQLDRAPNDEELLRLAQYPDEAGVAEALGRLMSNERTRVSTVEKLLAQGTKLEAKKVGPMLKGIAETMLASPDVAMRLLGLRLVAGFKMHVSATLLVEPIFMRKRLVSEGKKVEEDTEEVLLRLQTLRDLNSEESEVFFTLAQRDPLPAVRDAALEALIASVASTGRGAGLRLFQLYPQLSPPQRSQVLKALSGHAEQGASLLVTAFLDKTIPLSDLDGPTAERLSAVLGDQPDFVKLQQQLGGIFRQVLLLDGKDSAWLDSKITLKGAFTVECWVKLSENIGNQDSILGLPGQLDMNFFQSKFRVWLGDQNLHDVAVARKPMAADLWTHVAVTRDSKGNFKIYQNGELDAVGTKASTATFEDCRIGWSGPKQGTEGAFCEFRVWSVERNAAEIRSCFDRTLEGSHSSEAGSPGTPLLPLAADRLKPLLQEDSGVRMAKTIDSPPLLTEEQAQALDGKFARYSALAHKPGNHENGKLLSTLCLACHQIGNTGGQIGPNLSGVGSMGLEAVLRNILTPNAAMEPGYRIFRLEMANGDLLDAFLVAEDQSGFVVRQPGLPDRKVARAEVRRASFIRRSLMPDGMLDALSDEQVTDLLGYLMTLK